MTITHSVPLTVALVTMTLAWVFYPAHDDTDRSEMIGVSKALFAVALCIAFVAVATLCVESRAWKH